MVLLYYHLLLTDPFCICFILLFFAENLPKLILDFLQEKGFEDKNYKSSLD